MAREGLCPIHGCHSDEGQNLGSIEILKQVQDDIERGEAKCPSFLLFVQVFLNMKNGSDTSHTQLYQEALSLSRPARQRFKWMQHFRKYRNARLTCRHFGISPNTFYLWRKRFNPDNLHTLEDDLKTRKPNNLRKPKYTSLHIEHVKQLREVNPKIGKTNISRILKETGTKLSPSTVSRIISALKKYGRI